MISFTDKAEVARAGSLFLKLLSLDGLSNEALEKSGASDDSEVNATLMSLTNEMLELLENLEPAAGRLFQIVDQNQKVLDDAFPEVVAENAKYLNSGLEGLHIEPTSLVERFQAAGGFANATMKAADTLLFGVMELREELETRQSALANRQVPQADFPHKLMCALLIGAVGCAVIGGIAAGAVAGGVVAIIAAEGPAAGTILATLAGAASCGCF